ncbi:MAG: ABC transporter permease subunit [Verrucomicrobia bacterium]|nr:ABC transporter permease subunit [Verrucomicrobiota bacterium]
MENTPTQLHFSPGRMWTIGRNTMTEVIRQKFFYILVIFAIVVLMSSVYLSQFSSLEIDRAKFIKDFGLAAITVFGAIIAMVGTSQLLPLELENRTIYPILAKPVFRGEFLLGKYAGMAMLLLLTVVLMGLIFTGLLFYTEHQLVKAAMAGGGPTPEISAQEAARQAVQQILKQTRDPDLVKAVVLIYFKVLMVSAITLLISTFATSVIFSVVASTMVYICGHLEAAARQTWLGDQAIMSKLMLLIITFFVPDLNAFNVADAVVVGQGVPWNYVCKTVGYGAFYSGVALLVAHFIFQEKEI